MVSDLPKFSHLAGHGDRVLSEVRPLQPPWSLAHCYCVLITSLGLRFALYLKRGVVQESEGRVVFWSKSMT